MLVLTRKTQEQIHIGDNITISILKLKGNAVRIGIEAPRDVRVLRGELPTFDEAAVEAEASDAAASSTGESDLSEEDAAISEQQWELLKKLADRAKPCKPAPSCLPKQKAPLAAFVSSD